MPKPLREYTRREILRFRPALHWKREFQRRLRVLREARAPDADRRAREIASVLAARSVLITVAFYYADTIEVQGNLLRRNVGDGPWLIADNSADAGASEEIAALAFRYGGFYVKLPAYLWSNRSPGERHGAAMNWMWHNIIRPGKPKAFGFLDHDIYPIERTDPFRSLVWLPVITIKPVDGTCGRDFAFSNTRFFAAEE